MTPSMNSSTAAEAVELLMKNGMDGAAEAIQILMNTAMVIERNAYLGAGHYERHNDRVSYANGFKPKKLDTRIGSLNLSIPQTRDCKFYPQSLERGMRSEQALKLAVAEMYVRGVSTRKVTEITEKLCGLEITSTQVSRAAAELDVSLEKWRNRSLGHYRFVFLDARYEKVRHDATVVDCAVLIAIGVTKEGRREVLGCSVELSEQEVHWRQFLLSLQERGLHGVEMLISDAHAGLMAARKAVFPSVKWQRCQFHLQQNAQSYVPKQAMKRQVASRIRAMFDAPDQAEAERLLKLFIGDHEKSAPRLAQWAEDALPQGFTVFTFAEELRKKLRTSNVVERLNREIRRRTRVATMFPNEASCLRLVTAVVSEVSDEWVAAGRRWMTTKDDE